MTDRDHFAAAALAGLLARNHAAGDRDHCFAAYQWAEAMLRERSRAGQKTAESDSFRAACPERESTNHDAAPAARASLPTADHAVRRGCESGCGTGNQPSPPCVEKDGLSHGSRTGPINRTPERESPRRECGESQLRDVARPDTKGKVAGGPEPKSPLDVEELLGELHYIAGSGDHVEYDIRRTACDAEHAIDRLRAWVNEVQLSKVEIDALQHVVEDGRFVDFADYGHLRSLLVRLRPEWEFDRSQPINDERLAALEELSALDQQLELKHGITGNPMIKAQVNNHPVSYAKSDENRVLYDTKGPRSGALSGCETVPDPDSRVWETPCTPHPQATPPQGNVQGEGSFRESRNAKEPVAWAVETGGELEASFCGPAGREDAADWREQSDGVIVPLYRSPTITDEEREAVEWCVRAATNSWYGPTVAATLRNMLERLHT